MIKLIWSSSNLLMEGAQVNQVKVISYYLQSQVKWAYNKDLKLKSLENWVKANEKFQNEIEC